MKTGQIKWMAASAAAVLAYVASNHFGAALISAGGVAQCRASLMMLTCEYAGPDAWAPYVFEAMAIAAAAACVFSFVWLQKNVAYPFLMTMAGAALAALSYDALTARPVIEESRIISDTMNVLGVAILGSFLLVFALMRHSPPPVMASLTAVTVSFAAKTALAAVFWRLQAGMMGATELFVLFLFYAFGAFSLHLMTVSAMVRAAASGSVATVAQTQDRTYLRGKDSVIDGIRGVAILLVVVYHYVPTGFFTFNLGKPINSILFVVAGYFFAATLIKSHAGFAATGRTGIATAFDILARRHIRIWPMLVLIVLLYAALGLADGGKLTRQIWQDWIYVVTYLGYVPRWMHESQTFPPHLWVVAAQEGVILVMCAVCAKMGVETLRRNLWRIVVAGAALRCAGVAAFMPDHASLALESPFAILDPLAIGMLAKFELDRRGMGRSVRRMVAIALVGALACLVMLPNWNAVYFTFAPLVAALATAYVLLLSADDDKTDRLMRAGLGHPVLIAIGRVSLSAFLLHPLINTVVRLVFTANTGVELPWPVLFVVGPVLSFAAAWVMWSLVEEPLRKLKSAPGLFKAKAPEVEGATPGAAAG